MVAEVGSCACCCCCCCELAAAAAAAAKSLFMGVEDEAPPPPLLIRGMTCLGVAVVLLLPGDTLDDETGVSREAACLLLAFSSWSSSLLGVPTAAVMRLIRFVMLILLLSCFCCGGCCFVGLRSSSLTRLVPDVAMLALLGRNIEDPLLFSLMLLMAAGEVAVATTCIRLKPP